MSLVEKHQVSFQRRTMNDDTFAQPYDLWASSRASQTTYIMNTLKLNYDWFSQRLSQHSDFVRKIMGIFHFSHASDVVFAICFFVNALFSVVFQIDNVSLMRNGTHYRLNGCFNTDRMKATMNESTIYEPLTSLLWTYHLTKSFEHSLFTRLRHQQRRSAKKKSPTNLL